METFHIRMSPKAEATTSTQKTKTMDFMEFHINEGHECKKCFFNAGTIARCLVTNPEFLLTVDKKNWEETGNLATFLPLTNMEVSWTCLFVIKKIGCI